MSLIRCALSSILLFYILLLYMPLMAQQDSTNHRNITFHGTMAIAGYLANHQCVGQELPLQYLTWNLRGRLNVFGIPFNGTLMLSTLNSSAHQPLNNYSLMLDSKALLRSKLNIPGFAFLEHIDVFEIGRTRPSYSRLMLNGIMLNGINIGLSPGSFTTAFAIGTSLQPINHGSYWNQQHRQKMWFARIGLGQADARFIRLNVLRAKDIPGSLTAETHYYLQPADTFVYLADTFIIPPDSFPLLRKPGEAMLLGLETGLSFFKKVVRIQAELVGCASTSNIESEELQISSYPEWLSNIYQPRITTSLSYAGRISSELFLRTTQFKASFNKVAPGYQSPGVPFLRQDYRSIDLQGSQALFKRKFTLQPWFRHYRDNLSGMKAYTTLTLIYGITARWRPLHFPYLSCTWSPHRQKMLAEGGDLINKADIITLSAGKNYMLKKRFNAFTLLTRTNQKLGSRNPGLMQNVTGNYYSLQQSLMLKIPLSFNASMSYYLINSSVLDQKTFQATFGLQYLFRSKAQVGLGVRYSGQGTEESRTALMFNLAAGIGKIGKLTLSGEPVIYRDLLDHENDFNQYIIRCSFITNF